MKNKDIAKRFINITNIFLINYGVNVEYKNHRAYDDHSLTFVTNGDDYLTIHLSGGISDGSDDLIYTHGNKYFSEHIEFNTQKEALRYVLDYFNIETIRTSKKLSKSLNKELKINAAAKTKRIKL